MKVMVSMLVVACAFAGACTTNAPGGSATHLCRPEAAALLIGHAPPDNGRVEHRTGAELIRRIAPGDPVTHDFRANRITLAIDPAGKVVQAVCG
jgi:hypothetical protein